MGLFARLFRAKQKIHVSEPVRTPSIETVIEGRRHRADVPYVLPLDDKEIDRLDFQHYGLRYSIGGDYAAPIDKEKISSILDVGCGTGRWMLEMAKIYPQAQIMGIDIELPSPSTIPMNCLFRKGNVLEGIQYPDQSFDFVHQRLLVGAIPTTKWPDVVKELVRVTRPGGYVELLESGDIYINPGPTTLQFQAWWRLGSQRTGFDLSHMPYLDDLLRRTGLKEVTMRKLAIPLGKWGGREGEMMGLDIYEVSKSFKGFYVSKLGISAEQFDTFVAALPKEWEQYQTAYEFYLVYGRK